MTSLPLYIDASPFMVGHLTALMPDYVAQLRVNVGDPDPEALVTLAAGTEVILNGHTFMDAALLSRLPQLKRIVFLGSGASSYIDLPAAAAQGIEVQTIPGYGDRSVAEMAAALMFAATRQIATMDRAIRAGEWGALEGFELQGRTLGLIGFGGIGRSFAEIGRGLGMKIAIWNRSAVAGDWADCQTDLDTLLATSDVLSLHLSLTEGTRGFLGPEALAKVKPGMILINTARSALVDRPALVAALQDGRIAHAGLDVFEAEPLAADDPFPALPNVTLTAHAGFKTPDAARRLMAQGLKLALATA